MAALDAYGTLLTAFKFDSLTDQEFTPSISITSNPNRPIYDHAFHPFDQRIYAVCEGLPVLSWRISEEGAATISTTSEGVVSFDEIGCSIITRHPLKATAVSHDKARLNWN